MNDERNIMKISRIIWVLDEKEGENYFPVENSSTSLSISNSMNSQTPRRISRYIPPEVAKFYRRNAPFIPSIRILKRDIRRKYVEMIPNVMNSHDVLLFSSFIDDFYHPNCSSTHTYPEDAQSFFRPLLLKGKESLKCFHTSTSFLLPDGVVRFYDNKICQRLNEAGSRIIGKVDTTGTIIYIPKNNNQIPLDSSHPIRECEPSLEPPPPIRSKEDLIEKFQISTNPIQFIMRANYEIVLDEQNRFINMNFYCYEMEFTVEDYKI